MTNGAGKQIWAWDDTNKKWIKVEVDTEGRLRIVAEIDHLDDIGDVNVPAPVANDILYWDAAAGKWQDIAHLGVADAHHAAFTAAEHTAIGDGAPHHAAFTAADHTAIGDGAPHHAEAHDLASHTTKAHAELTNVTENQHHNKFTTVEHTAIGDGAPHHAAFTAADHTAIGDGAPHHAKYLDAEAVDAVEAAGLTLAATKKIILADDGVIQLGTLAGSEELKMGKVTDPAEAVLQPKNGNTVGELGILPKGTEDSSILSLHNDEDHDNCGFFQVAVDGLVAWLTTSKVGTGTAPNQLVLKFDTLPESDNEYELGHTMYRWKKVYAHACSLFPDLAGLKTTTITFIIDGGGSAITTGQKGHLSIPFDCTIEYVLMLADQSGSIVVDIWKDNYANFPPTDADSITAAAVPTISSAQKSADGTLTGWTTAIAAGDILAYNVDSCTTITRVTISLKVTKT